MNRKSVMLVILMFSAYANAQYYATSLLDTSDMASDLEQALTFNKYPTYDQYVEMMQKFANDYPEICRLDTIGYSRQNRLLLALKISDHVDSSETEARFFYSSSIHGDELSGYILMLRLADFLLSNYMIDNEVTALVNDLEIWINPISNPDGAYRNDNLTLSNAWRFNLGGRDLNRNFPDVSSGDLEGDTTGREKETIHMIQFLRTHKFNISANIHSGAEVVNYPWDYGPNDRIYNTYEAHPDDDWWYLISREYADGVHDENPNYMNLFMDGISNGSDWYRIKGGRQDYVTFFLQGRELTLELSNSKNEASGTLESLWNYNQWSLFNLMSQARYGIHGNVISAESAIPLGAKIEVIDYDSTYARIETTPGQFNWLRTDTIDMNNYPGAELRGSWVTSDSVTGNFIRYLKEGTYTLVISAEGYFNDTVQDIEVIDYRKTMLQVELDTAIVNKVVPRSLDDGFVTIFPNPARDLLHIRIDDPAARINSLELLSIDGKMLIMKGTENRSSFHTLDVSWIPPGACLLILHLDDSVIHRVIILE